MPASLANGADARRLKVLVAIASYGSRNDACLHRVLAEYAGMPYDVDVVVLSNIDKDLGTAVEVAVGLPWRNPWSLPFVHKALFAQRQRDHDLFIYSEDDTLVTATQIDAFLWATGVLAPDELAGFMRSEQGPDGTLHYSTIHNHYHWDVGSVRVRQGETFAHFTNEHGACYMLTRGQLQRAIASGGFCVPPHEGRYDLLVTAATDPYTQCGFTKLVCISRLADFTCQHLTNKYVGRTGLRADLLQLQIDALLDIARRQQRDAQRGIERPADAAAMRVEPRLPGTRWIKSYYEPCRDDLVALVPLAADKVLSVGCGWGSTEAALQARGFEVTAVPLDPVIGRLAAARGVRVVDAQAAPGARTPAALEAQNFDVLLVSGLLHLVDEPVDWLHGFRALLKPGGVLIASFPNVQHAAVWWRRLRGDPAVRGLADPARSGVHVTSLRRVSQWLRQAGYQLDASQRRFDGRWARWQRATFGLCAGLWATECVVVARSLRAEGAATPQAQLHLAGARAKLRRAA